MAKKALINNTDFLLDWYYKTIDTKDQVNKESAYPITLIVLMIASIWTILHEVKIHTPWSYIICFLLLLETYLLGSVVYYVAKVYSGLKSYLYLFSRNKKGTFNERRKKETFGVAYIQSPDHFDTLYQEFVEYKQSPEGQSIDIDDEMDANLIDQLKGAINHNDEVIMTKKGYLFLAKLNLVRSFFVYLISLIIIIGVSSMSADDNKSTEQTTQDSGNDSIKDKPTSTYRIVNEGYIPDSSKNYQEPSKKQDSSKESSKSDSD